MPRKPWIQATDAPYHITQRGVDKQAIVVDDDRRTLIRIFGQTVIEHRWSLRAFCLMDNHLRGASKPVSSSGTSTTWQRSGTSR